VKKLIEQVLADRWLSGIPRKACPLCGGCGLVADPKQIGAALRQQREYSGLSLREVARRMKLSAMYVCDLEHGRRGWDEELIHRYIKTVR